MPVIPVESEVPVEPEVLVPPRLRELVRVPLERDRPLVDVEVDWVPAWVDPDIVPPALDGTPPVLAVLLPVEPPVCAIAAPLKANAAIAANEVNVRIVFLPCSRG